MVDTVQPTRSLQTLLMGTFDLFGFVRQVRALDDEKIVEVLDVLYAALDGAVTGSGGRIVKYLGDGALAVWPPEQADTALEAAVALRDDVARALAALGVHTELRVTMHCGDVVAGEFGADRRYDVIGNDVFVAFQLPARTVSLSAEAFRRLSPEMRTRLKKHTEPVVYIPTGDPRP